jgi:hypothetical protein
VVCPRPIVAPLLNRIEDQRHRLESVEIERSALSDEEPRALGGRVIQLTCEPGLGYTFAAEQPHGRIDGVQLAPEPDRP